MHLSRLIEFQMKFVNIKSENEIQMKKVKLKNINIQTLCLNDSNLSLKFSKHILTKVTQTQWPIDTTPR